MRDLRKKLTVLAVCLAAIGLFIASYGFEKDCCSVEQDCCCTSNADFSSEDPANDCECHWEKSLKGQYVCEVIAPTVLNFFPQSIFLKESQIQPRGDTDTHLFYPQKPPPRRICRLFCVYLV